MIELKNIKKKYKIGDGYYEALRGINLKIEEGEFVALMGPSGSGKSTTMHIIGALDKPSSGEYIFNGRNIAKYSDNELSKVRNSEMGFVFQSFNLLPKLSVIDNVLLPFEYSNNASDSQKKAFEALARVGLREKADNMPNQISGGQIQRVAIARALVMNPKIILADEPTGNLDTKTSIEVMKIFQELNDAGNTIILVTHEPDIAKFAKRTIHLKDGVVVE
ncbi:ABC transporter ATP-binding protein [bacterium]|nr:MAG: ABC transporter ATP-binding protein [bacterium]